MKKLVCADEIAEFAKSGQKVFFVDDNTIITPAARDAANARGVLFSTDPEAATVQAAAPACDNACVCETAAPSINCEGIDKDVIYKVLKAMMDGGMLNGVLDAVPAAAPAAPYVSEKDVTGLKVVRGSSVKMDAFFPDEPDKKVYYQELIDKNDSHISSGIVVIDHSTYEWTQNYDENDYVIEGTMVVTINGRTYTAHAGDCLFIPNGSTVVMGSKDHCCKVFYNTYPSNWADLL